MSKLVKESLNEDELDYTFFCEVKDQFDEDLIENFNDAIEFLGADEKDVVYISSWNNSVDWDDLLNELNDNNIAYYIIAGYPDDDYVVFDINDLKK